MRIMTYDGDMYVQQKARVTTQQRGLRRNGQRVRAWCIIWRRGVQVTLTL